MGEIKDGDPKEVLHPMLSLLGRVATTLVARNESIEDKAVAAEALVVTTLQELEILDEQGRLDSAKLDGEQIKYCLLETVRWNYCREYLQQAA